MLEALRIRDFRLLWTGRTVSLLGSWLLVIAIPAHVFALTGSLLATGLTLVAEYLPPLLLGPFAGVVADRWDRRRVMITADLFRAAAVALMLVATAGHSLWLVYAALIAESTGAVLFRPAAQAQVPAVVGTGSGLSSANSLNAAVDGTVRLVAPPLGAVILTFAGFQTLIWIDVASYLVSAVAIALTTRTTAQAVSKRVFADLAGGWKVLRGLPIARALLPLTAVFLAANASLSALLVPFGVRQLGGSEQIGLVVSALGAGFLLGAVVIRGLVDRVQPRLLLAVSQLATAVAFLVLFSSTSLVVALPAGVAIGVFGSMTLVTPQTTLQRAVPNEALGRISAVFLTAEALATLVGALAGPLLAEAASLSAAVVVACVVTAGGALAGLAVMPRAAQAECAV
ncbi:MFS transporter [Lentzea flaviverrucosa]|uniref:Predicted arabinose efflux permease, MFS family n=1 Tax=Lentzea flaviverrucosa TaxID=200379 RepID=A0A1H9XE51_9PSEU|nr:MFS transporter [Lentzea flaviverrucosa]RDI21516.1 putative MFS family arabinose efflux permease [Lentzea flaviverrucosa]SES44488.1 Predicted arabinose efflux permease, MFS family [Lentzea flaviverrucosa]